MYELTGTIKDVSIDYITKHAVLSLSLDSLKSATDCYDELHCCEKLSIKIAKYKKKRSLDANAYFWTLCDKLSAKLESRGVVRSKEDIYRSYIKEIGGVSETVCVVNEAVEKLCEGWKHNGIGWQTETYPSKIEGCTNVVLYYGSSTYDTAQMSRLLNLVIEDCKGEGIQTDTPEQIERLLRLWKGV